MVLFAQFLLRLAFGLAACMATVSPRLVSSGYFRNHLYVTLGLAAMAALATGAVGSGGAPPPYASSQPRAGTQPQPPPPFKPAQPRF